MDEYASVCYLDMQKTGSTFVSRFLAEHLAEPRVRFAKHGRIRGEHDPRKLYFITCRGPLELYRSLFSFGCDGQGLLRRRLGGQGLGALYDRGPEGFERWLAFMLDPANAPALGEEYGRLKPGLIGFQTFRFLLLSFHNAMQKLARVENRAELRRLYEAKRIARRVLRTERLNADLADLVSTDLRPFVRDVDAAVRALSVAAPVNASSREDRKRPSELPPDLARRLEEREWFMFDVLGYERR